MGEVAGRTVAGAGRELGRGARLLVDDRRAHAQVRRLGRRLRRARAWSTTADGALTVWYGREGVTRRRAHATSATRTTSAGASWSRPERRCREPPAACPLAALCACVVVPARDEEELIGACIAALAAQDGRRPRRVRGPARARPLHRRDRGRARRGGRRAPGWRCTCSTPPAPASATRAATGWTSPASGWCAGPPDGLIATTDADSEPAPDWLRAQLDAVAGRRARDRRADRARPRRARASCRPPSPRSASARPRRGGTARGPSSAPATHRALAVQRRLARRHRRDLRAGRPARAAPGARGRGLRARPAPPRRPDRAPGRGPRDDVRAARRPRAARPGRRPAPQRVAGRAQLRRRRLHARAAARGQRAAASRVILPGARGGGDARPGRRGDRAAAARRAGRRGARRRRRLAATGRRRSPAQRGARVEDENDLLPDYGPCLGKGDAMWRGLAATSGELVAFVGHRHRGLHARASCSACSGRCSPSAASTSSRAHFRRPFDGGGAVVPDGGGRVTELLARPVPEPPRPRAGRLPPAARGRDRRAPRAARGDRRSRSATASRSRC